MDVGQVVEVGEVEHLEVDPGRAHRRETPDPVSGLLRGARHPVLAQLVDVAPDGLRAAAQGGVVLRDAHHLGCGADQAAGRPALALALLVDPVEQRPGGLGDWNPALKSAAWRTASSGVRRFPPPPMMIGTPPS